MRTSACLLFALLITGLTVFLGCENSSVPNATAQAGQRDSESGSEKSATDAQAVGAANPKDHAVANPAPATSRPAGPRDITFDDLKFDIQPDALFDRSLVTPEIEALDGARVRLRGYINPYGVFVQKGITQFIFVRDNMECCFGPGAALFDCAVVEMKPGKSTDYSIYPISVEGIFSIQELIDPDGIVRAVFHIEGESAK